MDSPQDGNGSPPWWAADPDPRTAAPNDPAPGSGLAPAFGVPPVYGAPGYAAVPTYGPPGYPPGHGGGRPLGPRPKTNLVSAVLATLLCCVPLGIVAIVYAAQVDTKWRAGDYGGAVLASKRARMWANLSFLAALVVGIGWFALVVSGTSTTSKSNRVYACLEENLRSSTTRRC